MKRQTLAGASAIALSLGIFTVAPASAQQGPDQTAPAAQEDCDPNTPGVQTDCAPAERVVVTGSNIAGAAESAALPVEVYTADDNLKQGNQTALEFVKSLSVSGETLGEANIFIIGTAGYGSSNINLRGLGGGRTLTIFNGRRFSENTNMIPQAALARTEILKDGGAVIYGADATGGVVNFISRDDFDGFIVDAEWKFIDGSKGDYGASVLWGKDFENSNLMFSAEYTHRSELPLYKRDWGFATFQENSSGYAPYNVYAQYVLRSAAGGALAAVSDFTTTECQNMNGPVPGFAQPNLFGPGLNACWWNYPLHYIDLVDEYDQVRTYAQYVHDMSDTLRFTASLAYGKSNADDISAVAAYNANTGPLPATGGFSQFRVPRANPGFATFLAQNASQINPAALGLIAYADQVSSIFWGPNGSPAWDPGEGTTPTTQLENWNAAAVFDGEFGEFGGEWLDTWKASLTYNLATSDTTQGDNVGYRIQQALNGFGGPNCNAPDLVPDRFDIPGLDANGNGVVSTEEFYNVVGTQNPAAAGKNGCLWLNPFANAFPANGVFGNPNPRYVAGTENTRELALWLFDERQQEDVSNNLTIDALVSGGTPLELPGGQVAWAAGAQWRQSEVRESTTSPFLDPDDFPCQWPGQLPGQVGCAPTGESPYLFWTQDNQAKSDQQQYSYFGEFQVPVLENLSFQLAVRREEFPRSDLGATVYKVAGKYDPFNWLAIRGSFGTNYATPPANIVPGSINGGIVQITRAGNAYLRTETETLSGIKPETAEVANFGMIFTFDDMPLNGRLRFSADYFNFDIKDEIKTVSHNAIVNSLVASSAAFVNCSSPVIDRITFRNGVGAAGCTQGTTIGSDITSVRSVFGNGPGAKTSGIDYDVSYGFDAFGGDLTASLTATQILTFDIAGFDLNGVPISTAYDALGFSNYSRDAGVVSEWRGNATLNYAFGNHNIRYVARHIQGVENEAQPVGTPLRFVDDFTSHNLYYQWTLPWVEDMTLSLSVENFTDQDPPFVPQQYNFDPWIGNALGRTFEIGLRKEF
jgi:iron complex outermembrane receptor protein